MALLPGNAAGRENSGVRRLRVLSDLAVGESGVLVALDLPAGVQNHLMYMGFVPDARVKVLHKAPAGDPTVYSVDGIEIALRRETARSISVSALDGDANDTQANHTQTNHTLANSAQAIRSLR